MTSFLPYKVFFFFCSALVLLAAATGAQAQGVVDRPNIYLSPEEIAEIKQGSACRNLVGQFFALQKRMAKEGLSTDFYDIKLLPSQEIVSGRKGRYYVVQLKDAEKKERFQFPGGQYTIADFETRFRSSLSAFVREVLAVIHGGAEYDLFVRGGSSSTQLSTKRYLSKDHKFNEVSYLPSLEADTYDGSAARTRQVPDAYTNEDLPFLRAAFLQNTMERFFPIKRPLVLEGRVGDSADAELQFAEAIMFVDW